MKTLITLIFMAGLLAFSPLVAAQANPDPCVGQPADAINDYCYQGDCEFECDNAARIACECDVHDLLFECDHSNTPRDCDFTIVQLPCSIFNNDPTKICFVGEKVLRKIHHPVGTLPKIIIPEPPIK